MGCGWGRRCCSEEGKKLAGDYLRGEKLWDSREHKEPSRPTEYHYWGSSGEFLRLQGKVTQDNCRSNRQAGIQILPQALGQIHHLGWASGGHFREQGDGGQSPLLTGSEADPRTWGEKSGWQQLLCYYGVQPHTAQPPGTPARVSTLRVTKDRDKGL